MVGAEGESELPPDISVSNVVEGNAEGPAVMAGHLHGGVHINSSAREVVVPRQLPRTSPMFTDRQTEFAELDRVCVTSPVQSALTVISGPGGVGKTTLAVQWLRRKHTHFPDGALYVDLGGHSIQGPLKTAEALGRFLRALGVPPEKVPHSIDEQAGLYRSMTADKSLSVLLDNAVSAHEIAVLLPASPTSVTVVTTRNRLSQLVSEGAHFLPLQPLDDEAAADVLRAGAGRRMEDEPEAAQSLISMCGGLPLALTVVSAQLAARPRVSLANVVRALADEQQRISMLKATENLSVESVFDLSYRELSGPAARLYRLLGNHPGAEFTLGVAAAVDERDARAVAASLSELTDASLIEETAEDRFRFHDLLRLHARHRSNDEDDEKSRLHATKRMLEWYLSNAKAADATARPDRRQLTYTFDFTFDTTFQDRRSALDWLEENRASLVAATKAAITEGFPELAWQTADAMWSLFLYRTYVNDRFDVNQLGIEAAVKWGNTFAEARMTYQLGLAYNDIGDHEAALVHMRRALVLREEIQDVRGVINTREAIGFVYLAQGKAAQAIEQFRRAFTANRAVGTQRRTALSALNLGRALLAAQRAPEALASFEEAQQLFARTNNADAYNSVRLDTFIARAHLLDRRLDQARSTGWKALSAMRELGSPFGQAEALELLGEVMLAAGDVAAARPHLEHAHELFEDLAVPEANRVKALLLGLPR